MYYLLIPPTTSESQNQTLLATNTTTQVALPSNSVLPTLPNTPNSQVLPNCLPNNPAISSMIQPLQTGVSEQNAMGISMINVPSAETASNVLDVQNILQIQNSSDVQTVFDNNSSENKNCEAPVVFSLVPLAANPCIEPIITQNVQKPIRKRKMIHNPIAIEDGAIDDLKDKSSNKKTIPNILSRSKKATVSHVQASRAAISSAGASTSTSTIISAFNPRASNSSSSARTPAILPKVSTKYHRSLTPDARNLFNQELESHYALTKEKSRQQWSQSRINEIVKMIEDYKGHISRTRMQYHYALKYDVVKQDNDKVLILKERGEGEPAVVVVPSERYFDIILDAHLSTNHGNRDKILQALKTKYFIPTSVVNIFLKYCKVCQPKKAKHDILDNRGIVSLIDMQKFPDGPFKFILHYTEYISKFTLLRPLTSNDIDEIALELLKIFLEIGCPRILDTSFGEEATAIVIEKIEKTWSDCKLIQGKQQQEKLHSENDADRHLINEWLRIWMDENLTRNWSVGIYFIQFRLNSTHVIHSSQPIGETPFKAFLGKAKHTKYLSYSIPGSGYYDTYLISASELKDVKTEEELELILAKHKKRRQGAAEDTAESVSVSDNRETVNEKDDSTRSDCENEQSDDGITDEIEIKIEEHSFYNESSEHGGENSELCNKVAASEFVGVMENFRIKHEIKEETEEKSSSGNVGVMEDFRIKHEIKEEKEEKTSSENVGVMEDFRIKDEIKEEEEKAELTIEYEGVHPEPNRVELDFEN